MADEQNIDTTPSTVTPPASDGLYRIKPLEWAADGGFYSVQANSLVGKYRVYPVGNHWVCGLPMCEVDRMNYPRADSAKAAAEQHYHRRVLPFLIPAADVIAKMDGLRKVVAEAIKWSLIDEKSGATPAVCGLERRKALRAALAAASTTPKE